MRRTVMAATAAIVLAVVTIMIYFAYANLALATIDIELTDPPTGWGSATQIHLNYSEIEIHRSTQVMSQVGWLSQIKVEST